MMKALSSGLFPYRRLTVVPFLILISALFWAVSSFTMAGETEEETLSSSPLEEELTLGEGGFTFSLNLLDPVSGKPCSSFFFGDEVGYKIVLKIPAEAEGKKATLKLTGSVAIGAVTMPFTASQVFTGPVTNPTYEDGNIYEFNVWKGKFELPSDIPVPSLTATIKLEVAIADIGTSTINKKITFKTRKKLAAPVLSYPAAGQKLNGYSCGTSSYNTNWYFIWLGVAGATKYEISIRNLADGSTFTYQTERRYHWGASPCLASKLQSWSWKVRAGNEYCWSAWSEERGFTIAAY